MTCDPVAGFVQIPCIERCAFGAVKSWTGYLIAKNEISSNRRVDIDAVITALAQTAKDMNPKYKETSEAGPPSPSSSADGQAGVTAQGQRSVATTSIGVVAVAWLLTAVFYFYQYSMRSAPAVMVPELSTAFGMSAVGVWNPLGKEMRSIPSRRSGVGKSGP